MENEKIKVLIIDDEPHYAEIISHILDPAEYSVAKSYTASQGIEKAGKLLPHVILLDWNLPDMEGIEVCRKLKTSRETESIPVIMFTSMASTSSKVTGLEAGADDYITKPFEPDELIARVNAGVRRFRKERLEIERNFQTVEKYISRNLSDKLRGAGGKPSHGGNMSLLFCDLCGFTALTRELPPEDIRGLLNGYFGIISASVGSRGGTIDKFIGDAAMALFSGSRAEIRAVEAAVEIHRGIHNLRDPSGRPLRVRIGIHAGDVLIDAVGTDERSDYTVIGSAVNLAAKLQQAAEPGRILVSGCIASAAGEFFRFSRVPVAELTEKYGIEPYLVDYET